MSRRRRRRRSAYRRVVEQERRRVAMVTIKGADQTRRDEGPPFIADFVTREPPPRNRRIRSLRATPPIHPSTPMLSSSAEAKSICGIERRAKRKTERERERERERCCDAYVASCSGINGELLPIAGAYRDQCSLDESLANESSILPGIGIFGNALRQHMRPQMRDTFQVGISRARCI